ncbi:hypothetical protein [Zavarzinella formosa]|uniref:hypothetical protein n=1 Tax=Zavarzinella formosa TaxID=360055 RepID=UPI0012F82B8F|nr:hypothetical protein [Zavarzinella formosa]
MKTKTSKLAVEGIEIGLPCRTGGEDEIETEGERFEEYSPEHVTLIPLTTSSGDHEAAGCMTREGERLAGG